MTDSFKKYATMKASGSTVDDVYRAAASDNVDLITRIRMIRTIFGLSHPAAKEVVLRADGESRSLDEHQEKIANELLENSSLNDRV